MFEKDPAALAWGVTPLENKFLLEYLPAAKGDYVKVYLWGLFRAGQSDGDYGPAEMAQDLFLTAPEIEAALRYWERRGLVSRLRQELEMAVACENFEEAAALRDAIHALSVSGGEGDANG